MKMKKFSREIFGAIGFVCLIIFLCWLFSRQVETVDNTESYKRIRRERDSIFRLYDSLIKAYKINEISYYIEISSKNETIKKLQKMVYEYDTLLHHISIMPEPVLLDSITGYYARQDSAGTE